MTAAAVPAILSTAGFPGFEAKLLRAAAAELSRTCNQRTTITNTLRSCLGSNHHKLRPIKYLNKPRQIWVIRDISERVRAVEEKLSALGLHKILLNLIGNSLKVVEETGMVNVLIESCKFSNPMATEQMGAKHHDYVTVSFLLRRMVRQ
jgi:hypothetical protein